MGYVVVIRKEGKNGGEPVGVCVRGEELSALLLRASRKFGRAAANHRVFGHIEPKREVVDWTPFLLERLKADYAALGPTKLAEKLSAIGGQRITKGSVTSKAFALGLCKRRP